MQLVDFKPQTKESFNLIGKIKIRVLVILALLTALLVAAQLLFAANLATDGQKFAQVEQDLQKLEAENTALRVEIAKLSALGSLSKIARDLGFDKPQQVITP